MTSLHLRTSITAAAAATALVAAGAAAPGTRATVPGQTTDLPARMAAAHLRPALLRLPSPDHFQRHVTNRYLPWKVGMRWIYHGFGSEGHQRDVVEVLARTKTIEGITATVVRDVTHQRGRLIERTFDWYAQDDRGRVWYLGENTHAYEHGHVSTAGSWEAGVHHAHAGVIMFRHPKVGRLYWQEFQSGVAEDQGRLTDRSTQVAVIGGHFDHVRMTSDTTPLEPRVAEFKFYAPGVGVVMELDTSPEQGRVVLVKVVRPAA